MDVLFTLGRATGPEIQERIPGTPSYSTVRTILRVLERKGYVGHLKDGRAHVYQPLVDQQEASRSEIRHLVSRFFKDSHQALLLNILRDEELNDGEVTRLREMLDGAPATEASPGKLEGGEK